MDGHGAPVFAWLESWMTERIRFRGHSPTLSGAYLLPRQISVGLSARSLCRGPHQPCRSTGRKAGLGRSRTRQQVPLQRNASNNEILLYRFEACPRYQHKGRATGAAKGRPKWSPFLRSGNVTKLTKSAKSRQTRDIFDRSSGFHPASKRQLLASKTRPSTPAQVTRLPPLP